MTTSCVGLSRESVFVASIFRTTFMPDKIFPNTTWRPSNHVVCFVVMKNCDPLVSLPALACLQEKKADNFFSWRGIKRTHLDLHYHAQPSRSVVLELEVLIFEAFTVDWTTWINKEMDANEALSIYESQLRILKRSATADSFHSLSTPFAILKITPALYTENPTFLPSSFSSWDNKNETGAPPYAIFKVILTLSPPKTQSVYLTLASWHGWPWTNP